MSGSDWAEAVGVVGLFLLVIVVLTMTIWQFGATYRAKAVLAREDEYRKLADTAVELQKETARELTELRGRLAAVEHILKDVE